jgi:hypothetical protein
MDCTRCYLGYMHACYINEKLWIFVYKWFGLIWMHMNIYVFFQNLNILCSFWLIDFFFFGFFQSGLVSHFWGQSVRSGFQF